MSKGYLVIAQNSTNADYVRMAYALALSIKNTQSDVTDFAIAVNSGSDVPDEYLHAFDHVIEIPWEDMAQNYEWKIQNKWKYYYMSPFEETVILDADMIFTSDISYWWDYMASKDVWATTNVHTYRGELVTSDYYRKAFTSNDLPNVYTAFMYFKKSKLAGELFAMIDVIFKNWERFFYIYLDETRPKVLSGDVAFALAMKILGIEPDCTSASITAMPSFVHMKPRVFGVPPSLVSDDWTESIPSYLGQDGKLKINNFEQMLPFHYCQKEWLTDQVVQTLEDTYFNDFDN